METLTDKELKRLESKFDRTNDGSCWVWKGPTTIWGYARFWLRRKGVYAHRLMYTLYRGPIPNGLILHHVCKNPSCVNPNHLTPISNKKNILWGNSPSAVNFRKTHCKQGHEFTKNNTYIASDGERGCRKCHANRQKKYRKGKGNVSISCGRNRFRKR